MAEYVLHITDGKQTEVTIDAANDHEAINDGLNALHAFVSRNFPPPENIAIDVMTDKRSKLATLSFAFQIDYADGVRMM